MQDEYYKQMAKFMENGFNVMNQKNGTSDAKSSLQKNGTSDAKSSPNGSGVFVKKINRIRARASGPVTGVSTVTNSKKNSGNSPARGSV